MNNILIRTQKQIFAQKKIEIQEEIAKKKKEIMEKFEKINKNNGITPEAVKELFPDDKELYEKIVEMKANPSQIMETKPNSPHKKYEKQLKTYNDQLKQELNKIVEEEKVKEKERQKNYNSETNEETKKELQEEIMKERELATQRLSNIKK